MKIAFVFTNFNNSQYSIEAIRSICPVAKNEAYIVIVDNNSNNENVELLKTTKKNTKMWRLSITTLMPVTLEV